MCYFFHTISYFCLVISFIQCENLVVKLKKVKWYATSFSLTWRTSFYLNLSACVKDHGVC
jgi:hypothetical protein